MTLKPIANVCDLVTPAEVSQAMGAQADAPASSTPSLCAYVSKAPAPGGTDSVNLTFGYDPTNKGRPAFDALRANLQITDVSGVGDAAIIQDNQNGTGKLIFIKADTIFTIDIATSVNGPVTNALVAFAKLLASRA